MPFLLKPYQQDCLDALAAYFARVDALKAAPGIANPAQTAFDESIRDQSPRRWYKPVPQLQFSPYVCLRVPTGGGKTFLAAHALKIAADRLFRTQHILTLWLAPTKIIVEQTLRALRNRAHPYRQAVDVAFNGDVTVLSLEEAFCLQRATLDSSTVIIVSTFAALNVEKTENRRIYDENGSIMPAFTGLDERQRQEIADTNGSFIPSLANMIRLRHPFIIMDEAHNARTPRAFDTLRRFSPLGILELTATPSTDSPPSNVLHHVSAAQLKADGMIKLPVKLRCRPQWREAVAAALAEQNRLEQLAVDNEQRTGRYIRPIVLFQAQSHRQGEETVTAEVLKQSLITDFKVAEDRVAIATGESDQLGSTDLFDRSCPLRFIITVQKLREGWDCSFAYILCSVTNLSSHTAVEQLLGRIPHAQKNNSIDLDSAYAFVTSTRFMETANNLKDSLVDAGFSRFEADQTVESPEGPLFNETELPLEALSISLDYPLDVAQLPVEVAQAITFDPSTSTVTYRQPQPMPEYVRDAMSNVVVSDEDRRQVDRLYRRSHHQDDSPAVVGSPFAVPRLAVLTGDQTELFEDQFRDQPWSLADADATITPELFSITSQADRAALLDVSARGQITASFIEESQHQLALYEVGPKTITELTTFLAKQIHDPFISHAARIDFLHRALRHLVGPRGVPLEHLIEARFKLSDALALRIEELRKSADRRCYQEFLLPDCATPIQVSPAIAFQFPRHFYPCTRAYTGPFQFRKHYYAMVGDLNDEEAQCAVSIDTCPGVRYWVRNIERRPEYSFWLQTSTDKFYPDFVALLTDGRYLAVEYKGAHLESTDDTREKQCIGELWESRSDGQCLFRLATTHNVNTFLDGL